MKTFVIMSGSRKLSGFYPNGLSDVFAFRRNDWYGFRSKQVAEEFISVIRKRIEREKGRYGKYAKLYESIAENLKIREDK
jgi:hypothetical protein